MANANATVSRKINGVQDMELLTVGQISNRLQEPTARVRYIIDKYRLEPVRRVGIIRMFTEEQLKAIKDGLYNIQVRR